MPDDDVAGLHIPVSQPSALERLRAMWQEALANTNTEIDDAIDKLVTCSVVSIRYALLTQLLGKLSDPTRTP